MISLTNRFYIATFGTFLLGAIVLTLKEKDAVIILGGTVVVWLMFIVFVLFEIIYYLSKYKGVPLEEDEFSAIITRPGNSWYNILVLASTTFLGIVAFVHGSWGMFYPLLGIFIIISYQFFKR